MNKKNRRAFLIGTLLGDTSFSGKKNKHILFGHCEKQKNYGVWKLMLIGKLFHVATRHCEAKGMEHSSYKRTKFYRFWTVCDHRFTALYRRMVPNGKKQITPYVLSHFNEISLAFLFMDDGCKETAKGRIRSYKFSLGSFSLSEVTSLAKLIKDKWDINSTVFLEKKKYPSIKISKNEDRKKFVQLIQPFLHPDMMYKIQL